MVAVPYETAYEDLVTSLAALCGPETILLLCYQRRHAGEQRFFEMLSQRFTVDRLPRAAIHEDFKQMPIWIYRCALLTVL